MAREPRRPQGLRAQQTVSVQEETLAFELRLDATDALDAGDEVAAQFGIAPILSTLELMTYPKGSGVLSQALATVLGAKKGYQCSARRATRRWCCSCGAPSGCCR